MYKIREAFTLAEILITLSIIGVIASMTIPSLVQDIQEAQFKTAWKRAFADLNHATKRLILINGGNLKGMFSNNNELKDKYKVYLNYIKECSSGASANICWHEANSWKFLNGQPYGISNWPSLILNNGSLVFLI